MPRPKNQTCSRKRVVLWPCRRSRQGPKTIRFWRMCGLLALVPQASKKTLGPKKHFEIPLTVVVHPQVQLEQTKNVKIAQKLCPGGPGGPRSRNKSVKNVWGRRPHTFLTWYCAILTPGPPPDIISAQSKCFSLTKLCLKGSYSVT